MRIFEAKNKRAFAPLFQSLDCEFIVACPPYQHRLEPVIVEHHAIAIQLREFGSTIAWSKLVPDVKDFEQGAVDVPAISGIGVKQDWAFLPRRVED